MNELVNQVFSARPSASEQEGAIITADMRRVPREEARCRLLYVVGQLALGGLERQLYYLLSTLERSRYRPALVAWNLNPVEKYYRDIAALKIPIYGLPSPASPLVKLRAFRKLARDLAPEVIHSYGFHTNFAAHYAASGAGAVAVGSLRSDFYAVKRAGGKLRGALNARWPRFHVSNSYFCAQLAQKAPGYFVPKEFAVVRNGLDLKAFRPEQKPLGDTVHVLGVGSLLPVKRWDRFLKAIREVNKLDVGNLRFSIAGDGPLRAMLEREAASYGITGKITFLGSVHDVPSLLRDASFLVHTSESEGCPNVVMEAMACGLPVVAMDAGDISGLIDDGTTGFIVRQDDEGSLVKRILQISNDWSLRQTMGNAARAKAEREFSLDRLVLQTLAAYRSAGWVG
ncbi:MAG: glycosyltransferase [Nitrospira sp.]|nr:glycosyltransferase [Nitrospira sp.]